MDESRAGSKDSAAVNQSSGISMNKLMNYISRLPPGRLLAQCLVLVAVIGFLDYQTGYEMNMAVVYLAPIFAVAWALGTNAAIVMSIICTTAWYLSMLNM